MSTRIKFPDIAKTAEGPSEADQVITLVAGAQTLFVGGAAAYASIAAWKKQDNGKASAYLGVVIEIYSSTAQIIGDGSQNQAIGLFGEILDTDGQGTPAKYLLGLLGMNLGGTVPQIPCSFNAASEPIAFAQMLADVSCYDALSIGGVLNDIDVGDDDQAEVSVVVRPIRNRDYLG